MTRTNAEVDVGSLARCWYCPCQFHFNSWSLPFHFSLLVNYQFSIECLGAQSKVFSFFPLRHLHVHEVVERLAFGVELAVDDADNLDGGADA